MTDANPHHHKGHVHSPAEHDDFSAHSTPENELQIASDEQTGKTFKIVHEKHFDSVVANLTAVYQLLALVFLLWLLFDTWSGRNWLLRAMGYSSAILLSGKFRLMAFVAIAGGIGGVVSGIRTIIVWHCERRAYAARFVFKDLTLAPVGAALGLVVYVTVRGGVGVLDGNFSLDQKGVTPTVTAFAIAWVAGFASWKVFHWLDAQANKLFSVVKRTVPRQRQSQAVK